MYAKSCVVVAYLVLIVASASGFYNPYIHQRTQGYPWPLPAQFSSDPATVCSLSSDFVVDFGALASCDIMINGQQRLFRAIFDKDNGRMSSPLSANYKSGVSSVLVVRLLSNFSGIPSECLPGHYPPMNMDEAYNLTVDCSGSSRGTSGALTASSIWGLVRGLETFSQLVYYNGDGDRVLNKTVIIDEPAFEWRGVLLDTSRHYLPVQVLMDNLDALAMNKYNVFHWHIIDDPSFPYVLESLPELAAAGAYQPAEQHVYLPSDVRQIVEKGRLLGIRIIPEFDTPGHSYSWGAGMPQLLTQCYDKNTHQPTGSYGPFDVTNPELWSTLNTFFKEAAIAFPDQYVHLGGDEVYYEADCWISNPNIQKLMTLLSFTTFQQLQGYYTQDLLTMLDVISNKTAGYVFWEEVFDAKGVYPPSDRTMFHVWFRNQSQGLGPVTKAGKMALFSYCWYLDNLNGVGDWKNFYDCDPLDFVGTKEQYQLVKGGEACLWGENVDGTNVLQRLWPRAAAVAERLWTDPRKSRQPSDLRPIGEALTVNDAPDVALRIEEQRCRMIRRGLPAQPVSGPSFCGDSEYQPRPARVH